MGTPNLSIIMPAFNAEAYLREAVDSILAQTYGDFELIVVNDGSTDGSAGILNEYRDERIRLTHNDRNRGIVYSRNRGLAEARGRFIAPFDADDVADPYKFEKQIRFLSENPDFGLIGSWAYLMDSKGSPMGKKWRVNLPPNRIPAILLFNNYFVQSAVVIRREAIPEGGYQEGLDGVEDYMMWWQIAGRWKVWNYPDYLLSYRVHEEGITMRLAGTVGGREQRVLKRIYERLNIHLTADQLQVLRNIREPLQITGKLHLQEVEEFLRELGKANHKLEVVDPAELDVIVANRWMKACLKSALPFWQRLRVLMSSPLLRGGKTLPGHKTCRQKSAVQEKSRQSDDESVRHTFHDEGEKLSIEPGMQNGAKPEADISLLAANYNNGEYLEAFVLSVMGSSCKPRELIIVDDGSTDGSRAILEKHASLPWLKILLFESNKGFTAALNAGLQMATSKYVMRADPDDILHPDRIARQYQFLEARPDVDMLGCNAVYFLDGVDGKARELNRTNFPTTHDAIVKAYQKGEHGLLHATVCGKREVYQKYRYQDLSPGEDYELFARMARDGYRFAALDESLYKVRVHPGSSSSQITREAIWRTFDFRDRIFLTKTSKRKRWIYFWHIRQYRRALLARHPIKKHGHLLAATLLYPQKLIKRLKR